MNQTHVYAGVAGAGAVQPLNLILTWLLTWPIVPPTPDQISAISSIVIAAGLLVASRYVPKAEPSPIVLTAAVPSSQPAAVQPSAESTPAIPAT